MKKRTPEQKLANYKRALMLLWSRSPMKWEAYNRARISTGLVRCEKCRKDTHWKLAEYDHIIPVGSINDPGGIAGVAFRMNCDSSGLQVLCESCHLSKSTKENNKRRDLKKTADKKGR